MTAFALQFCAIYALMLAWLGLVVFRVSGTV